MAQFIELKSDTVLSVQKTAIALALCGFNIRPGGLAMAIAEGRGPIPADAPKPRTCVYGEAYEWAQKRFGGVPIANPERDTHWAKYLTRNAMVKALIDRGFEITYGAISMMISEGIGPRNVDHPSGKEWYNLVEAVNWAKTCQERAAKRGQTGLRGWRP